MTQKGFWLFFIALSLQITSSAFLAFFAVLFLITTEHTEPAKGFVKITCSTFLNPLRALRVLHGFIVKLTAEHAESAKDSVTAFSTKLFLNPLCVLSVLRGFILLNR